MPIFVARSAPIAAEANWKGRDIRIWNISTGEKLSEFVTVHDGQARLAISSTGERLVAANWRKGKNAGVACYETASGQVLWHRTDLGQIQHMSFSASDAWVWCCVESRPVHCPDARSGELLKKWRGVRDAIDSPHSPHVLALGEGGYAIGYENKGVQVRRLTRSRLNAAFSPDTVAICEYEQLPRPGYVVQGYIRCIVNQTGKERWRYKQPENYFMQLISYQRDGFFYGIESACLDEKWVGGIIRLSPEDGTITKICALDPPCYSSGFGNGVFVTKGGAVLSLTSGETVCKLNLS
jgi:hypothetical protein